MTLLDRRFTHTSFTTAAFLLVRFAAANASGFRHTASMRRATTAFACVLLDRSFYRKERTFVRISIVVSLTSGFRLRTRRRRWTCCCGGCCCCCRCSGRSGDRLRGVRHVSHEEKSGQNDRSFALDVRHFFLVVENAQTEQNVRLRRAELNAGQVEIPTGLIDIVSDGDAISKRSTSSFSSSQ